MLKLTITDPSWEEPIVQDVQSVKLVTSYIEHVYYPTPQQSARGAVEHHTVKEERLLKIVYDDGSKESFSLAFTERDFKVEPNPDYEAPDERDYYAEAEANMCTDPGWMND